MRGLSRPARYLVVLSTFAVMVAMAVPGVSGASTSHSSKKAGSSNPFKGKYYISLGDSYSVGYQPNIGATSGYTGYVASKLKMNLENFGCGGATTTSILTYNGVCGTGGSYSPPAATDVGPVIPGDTQVQNALAFIAAHPGQIGLVTVSIGGNDVTACASNADPITCVEGVTSSIQTNVTTLAQELRTAVGAGVPIVGLTYPDVILGSWVYPIYPPSSSSETLVSESVLAFEDLINPALDTAYTASPVDGLFVDVTSATGYLTPLTTLAKLPKSTGVTDVPKKTKVPEAVVKVCELTYYCTQGNIHADNKGYELIGKLIKDAVK